MTEAEEPHAGEDKRPSLRRGSFILRRLSGVMRRSDVNYRLLLPLLAGACLFSSANGARHARVSGLAIRMKLLKRCFDLKQPWNDHRPRPLLNSV